MTWVHILSRGPELFVYTFESPEALVASYTILWPVTYVVDRMQYD